VRRDVVPEKMKKRMPSLLAAMLLAGCATDRFALIDRDTRDEHGPFLLRTGSPVRIGEKTYSVKRLASRDAVLTDRMKSYIIPEIDFRDAHIQDVVEFCREPGIVWDAHDAVVNPRMDVILVVPKDRVESIPRVTFSARLLSLYKAMEIMAELTGLEFAIEDGHAWLKWKD
jgi:hypothetical protein